MTRGFTVVTGFMSIVVFVTFVTNMTAEYGNGTLRVLLTRQPDRARLLAGKVAALVACTAAALLLAELVSAVTAVVAAGPRGVPTAEWSSPAGLLGAAGGYLNALLNATFLGELGTAVGVIVRSTTVALGVGLVWFMPVEHILQNAWAGAGRWLPGLVFEAVGRGGTAVTSYQRSVVLALLFAGIGLAAGAGAFLRGDVKA